MGKAFAGVAVLFLLAAVAAAGEGPICALVSDFEAEGALQQVQATNGKVSLVEAWGEWGSGRPPGIGGR